MTPNDKNTSAEQPKRPQKPGGETAPSAARAHAVPFIAWMLLMLVLSKTELPSAVGYAMRTSLCVALLAWLRPWRWYTGLRVANLPVAVLVGVVVCVVWILPESPWLSRFPALQEFCLRHLMLPFGKLPVVAEISAYAPDSCGWPLTIVRLLGSAVVIAVIEEFFWRGFLYRWLRDQDFVSLDLGAFDWKMLLLTSVLFGFEHQRWFVGILAGLAYGWLAIRTRDIWAVSLAHGITNLLLGLYVLKTGAYGFW